MKQGWERKKLGEVCYKKQHIVRATKKYSPSDNIAYIDISAIDSATNKITEPAILCFQDAPSRAQQVVKKDDILISLVRPNLKNIAQVSDDRDNLVASSGFCVLRTTENPRYIRYVVLGEQFTNYLISRTSGANYPAVREDDIREYSIPVPPLPIQEKIVSELDCLSGIIDKKRQQLKELDALAQSIFYTMFGDPVENDKGWEVKKLGEVAKIRGGYAFKSNLFCKEGLPVLRIGNINTGIFKINQIVFYKEDKTLEKYIVYPKDLVMSLTGTAGKDDYGNVCVLDNTYPQYYLNQRNAKIELSKTLTTNYLKYFLKDTRIKSRLTGVSRGIRQGNISNKDIEGLSIHTPPLPLQQEFAKKIEAIEKQKELIKASIGEVETLLASRMQEYFE